MQYSPFLEFLLYFYLISFVLIASLVQGQCPMNRFQCDSGRCIPSNWKCDTETDCEDGSDEIDCELTTCSGSEFECNSNDQCIPVRWACDEDEDCEDGSDEDESICADRTCPPDHFNCGEGDSCIPLAWVCDHDDDCANGMDEDVCDLQTCPADSFSCSDGSQCVSTRWVCDGETDCSDGSDEVECPESTCAPLHFQCNQSQYCIPEDWTCDGDHDCEDGSDEAACGTEAAAICDAGLFQCGNGDCIHDAWKCDGENDCDDGEDERSCPTPTCNPFQYTCANGQCVTGSACNQRTDCEDGSDEQGCDPEPPAACSDDQFPCGDGTCLPLNQRCDGIAQCADGQDESSMDCAPQTNCEPGYRPANMSTCVDIDECKDRSLHACSHDCFNHIGHYTCKCQEGYELVNHTHCKAAGYPASVVYIYHNHIRKYNISTMHNDDVYVELSNPLALEMDIEDGLLFWSDSQEGKIMMGNIKGTDVPVAVVENVHIVDGIGYDWIHKNLYWTDTHLNTVNVASRTSGNRVVLFSDGMDEPRAIVVDPRSGYMYWTDWGSMAKIERAAMNGESRTVIMDASKMQMTWPNGLAIDYPTDRLFWVDAKHHLLGTCDFNGDYHRVVLQDPNVLMHPFQITVFQDDVFWTDWDAFVIRRANKFTGRDVQDAVTSLSRASPNGLQIWQQSKQPAGSNACESLACSYLGIAAPHGGCTCVCPEGAKLSEDGVTCTGYAPVTEGNELPSEPEDNDANTPNHLDDNDANSPNHQDDNANSPNHQDDNDANSPNHQDDNANSPNHQDDNDANSPNHQDDNAISPNRQEYVPIAGPSSQFKFVWIILLVVVMMIVMAVVILVFVWRRATSGSKRSMNFDNPVYIKTTTTEDQLFLSTGSYEHNTGKKYQPIIQTENVI